MVGVEYLLVDDVGGGENCLVGEFGKFIGVIFCNRCYFIRIICGDLLVLFFVIMLMLFYWNNIWEFIGGIFCNKSYFIRIICGEV